MVTADRQETLDLLQRDSRGLERALQEAGLDADSDNLSFSLRQQNQDGQATAENQLSDVDDAGDGAAAPDDQELPRIGSDRTIDIRV